MGANRLAKLLKNLKSIFDIHIFSVLAAFSTYVLFLRKTIKNHCFFKQWFFQFYFIKL